MVSFRHGGHDGRHGSLLKRSGFAVLPLFMFGGLATMASPAGASTSSPSVTQAASTGVPDLGPTIAAAEAQVALVVANVLKASVPLVGSVGCIPYYVNGILSGDRLYPC
jgi:hypothetical protein